MTDFYYLPGPSGKDWGGPPKHFSYSTLSKMKICLLSYQLGVSRFGSYKRMPERPSLATIYGTLVHEVLEELFRELCKEGLPERGSSAFSKIMRRVNPIELIEVKQLAATKKLKENPRAHDLKLEKTTASLYGDVATLFQQQYEKACARKFKVPKSTTYDDRKNSQENLNLMGRLRRNSVLSEIKLMHPNLPLKGTIDTVYLDDNKVVIADFKTGKVYETHQDQLGLYALLWWRSTNILPARTEVVYFSNTNSFTFDKLTLEQIEQELADKIDKFNTLLAKTPAPSNISKHCLWCSARAYCDKYFKSLEPQKKGYGDIEVIVKSIIGLGGFIGTFNDKTEVNVVVDKAVGQVLAKLARKDFVRLLNGVWSEGDGYTFRVTRHTEIFLRTVNLY